METSLGCDTFTGPQSGRIRSGWPARSVASHFPPAQAAKLTSLLADRARLEALPINELVSLTVRN